MDYTEDLLNSYGPLFRISAEKLIEEIKELELLAINLTREEEDKLMAEVTDKFAACVYEIRHSVR